MDRRKKGRRPKQNPNKLRLFIGLFPGRDLRDQIRDLQRELAPFSYKLKFVNIEQAHLTIKFLGDRVSKPSADIVIDKLTRVQSNLPSQIITSESVEFGFSNTPKPKTIYLKIQTTPELDELIRKVQDATKSLQLADTIRRKDSSRFLGHITVARVKKDISKSQVKDIREILERFNFETKTSQVDKLSIIRSELTNNGPVYRQYASIPLKG